MKFIQLTKEHIVDLADVQCVIWDSTCDGLLIMFKHGDSIFIPKYDGGEKAFKKFKALSQINIQEIVNNHYDEQKRSKFRKNQCKGECHD